MSLMPCQESNHWMTDWMGEGMRTAALIDSLGMCSFLFSRPGAPGPGRNLARRRRAAGRPVHLVRRTSHPGAAPTRVVNVDASTPAVHLRPGKPRHLVGMRGRGGIGGAWGKSLGSLAIFPMRSWIA